MTIKRFFATKDNTITDAYHRNLTQRGKDANMGQSDILEVFSIYARATTSSMEASRVLIQFDVNAISSSRNNEEIPMSGSVNFVMRLFNAPHQETLPEDFTLVLQPISASWNEGFGLDMENYLDKSISGSQGSTWKFRSSNNAWMSEGGDYLTSPTYKQTFSKGTENLEIDITSLVEEWLAGTKQNYGVGVFLTSSQESSTTSFYTKRFFARETEFFNSRPTIEARWNPAISDDRGRFYASSSLASSQDNLNTLYFYNHIRQRLTNIPSVGTGSVYVSFWTSASAGTQLTSTPNNPITGGWVSTGVYTASVALNTTASVVYDRWSDGSTTFYTGQIEVRDITEEPFDYYVSAIEGLKESYSNDEDVRMRVFLRERNWKPNIYSVAQSCPERIISPEMFYKVFRTIDGLSIIDYGTGSTNHTKLSYDVNGNYFDLDFSLFEPGYIYSIKFLIKDGVRYFEPKTEFKFRVENSLE